jgi:Flp pilus assembly protein TadD
VQTEEAIRLKPFYAPAHQNLGSALFKKGRVNEAIAEFQEAIRLKPDDAGTYNNLGVALVDQERLDDAIVQYQKALQLLPEDADTHFNFGVALYKTGELEASVEQFLEADRLKPNNPETQARLKLTTELQRVIKFSSADPATLNNAAWELATSPGAAIRSGPLAVKLAENACEQTRYQVTVMVGTLAAAYAEAGRFDEAIATAEKACALAREHGETELLKRNQELLQLYQKHQPYREKF